MWWLVSVCGLLADIVGVALLFVFPPLEWGTRSFKVNMTDRQTVWFKRKQRLRPSLSKLALGLLVLGFVLQIFGTAGPNVW